MKLVVDLRLVRSPAQAYVMLSRVQSIDQIYILEEFDENAENGEYADFGLLKLPEIVSLKNILCGDPLYVMLGVLNCNIMRKYKNTKNCFLKYTFCLPLEELFFLCQHIDR